MAREITYLDAIREALREEMRRDPQVFVLGEDVGAYGGAFGITKGLQEEFGEYRCLDMPISESCIIGVSVGASLRGFRPVAEMQFGDFITCGFDQIVNQAATLRYRYGGRAACPIVVRAPVGGNVAGGLYHSQNPESWFVHRPGLKVVAPSTAWDAKGLLKAAIRDNNPVIYLEHKYLYRRAKGPVPEGDEIGPIGEAAVRREGADVTIVAIGWMVGQALAASEQLAADGIDAEVIDPRTIAPLDTATILASVEKTGRLVVVDQATRHGSVAVVIAAEVASEGFSSLKAPVELVTALDATIPYSEPMEQYLLPDEAKIVAAAQAAVGATVAA
jgi:pyruvate/2-oxoglutarate/acetoin dehydrogenase E1 component